MGCKGGAEIAIKIRAERSSPRIVSGTNCRGGGVCQALSRHSLFLAGVTRSVLVDYREGLAIQTAGYKLCSVEKMACSWRL